MTDRYYAQFTTTDALFKNGHAAGWHIFDRERHSERGEDQPIALCISRDVAFRIEAALNFDAAASARERLA